MKTPWPSIYMAVTCAVIAAACAGCAATSAEEGLAHGPLVAEGLPRLAGQETTCAGPRIKSFTLEATETTVDLGQGLRFNAWTYNGKLPGPTLEACEGDRVKITMSNHAGTAHGLDSHALRADTMHFGPVGPTEEMTIERTVDTPGAFMYHCASGPVTDLHIKSGLYGAMIVYPRSRVLPSARELVLIESGVYGDADTAGLIPGASPARTQRNDPTIMMFNGHLEQTPLAIKPGDRVRVYAVNVGPGTAALHVMGTILETVYDGSLEIHNTQTYGIPAGGGAVIDFRIPEAGMYGLVDHDRLAFLPYGMVLMFDATGGRAHSGM